MYALADLYIYLLWKQDAMNYDSPFNPIPLFPFNIFSKLKY